MHKDSLVGNSRNRSVTVKIWAKSWEFPLRMLNKISYWAVFFFKDTGCAISPSFVWDGVWCQISKNVLNVKTHTGGIKLDSVSHVEKLCWLMMVCLAIFKHKSYCSSLIYQSVPPASWVFKKHLLMGILHAWYMPEGQVFSSFSP